MRQRIKSKKEFFWKNESAVEIKFYHWSLFSDEKLMVLLFPIKGWNIPFLRSHYLKRVLYSSPWFVHVRINFPIFHEKSNYASISTTVANFVLFLDFPASNFLSQRWEQKVQWLSHQDDNRNIVSPHSSCNPWINCLLNRSNSSEKRVSLLLGPLCFWWGKHFCRQHNGNNHISKGCSRNGGF